MLFAGLQRLVVLQGLQAFRAIDRAAVDWPRVRPGSVHRQELRVDLRLVLWIIRYVVLIAHVGFHD